MATARMLISLGMTINFGDSNGDLAVDFDIEHTHLDVVCLSSSEGEPSSNFLLE